MPPKITTIKFSQIYNLGNMRSKMKNHKKTGLWKIIPSVSKFSRKINNPDHRQAEAGHLHPPHSGKRTSAAPHSPEKKKQQGTFY